MSKMENSKVLCACYRKKKKLLVVIEKISIVILFDFKLRYLHYFYNKKYLTIKIVEEMKKE